VQDTLDMVPHVSDQKYMQKNRFHLATSSSAVTFGEVIVDGPLMCGATLDMVPYDAD
jgi:hypothetical protein